MADLVGAPSWDPVLQLETNTVALGGPGGVMNEQAQALLNRTEFLQESQEDLADITDAAKNAGMVGFLYSLAYASGTVGRWLKDLALAAGSAFIGWIQDGAGAVLRTIQDKLRDQVSAKDFGAVGDGVTDDAAAVLAAATSLGPSGGSVLITRGMKCLIDTSITIPPNVSLVGPHKFVGSPGTNASAPYGDIGGVLIINSAASITLSGGASVVGLLVYRKGMTFPATSPASFAGTAFIAAGDDVAISRSMILGFNFAYLSNGFQRPRLSNLCLDNNNGIDISDCADVAYLHTIHQWPFATIGGTTTLAKDTRSGSAINLHDQVDWGKVTDCFSWGYFRSVIVNNANSVTLKGCGADNFYNGSPGYANTIGFLIQGTSKDTRLIACQSAAQATAGVNVNTSAGVVTHIINHNVWGGSSHGVLVSAGDVQVMGGCYREIGRIVSTTNAASRIFVNFVRSQGITVSLFLSTVATNLFSIGSDNDYGDTLAGTAAVSNTVTSPTIASAASINLPPSGNTFSISGTTGISAILAGWKDREVTLIFGGALTITSATTNSNSVRLSGGANFSVTAGGTLSIKHNGTQWFEIGRSA